MSLVKSSLLGNKNNSKPDLIIVAIATIMTYLVTGYLDLAEQWLAWTNSKESYQLDEIIFVLLVLSLGLMWFGQRRYNELQTTLQHNLEITTTLEENNLDIAKLLEQNRALVNHITQVREAERNHLASELHDVFGQYLAAIDVNAAVALKQTIDDKKLHSILETIQDSANYLRNATRSQLHSIKPPSLESVGLSASIEDLLSKWLMSFPTYDLSISIDVNDKWVNYDTGLTIYRCLQEGLSNIIRHANANKISIMLVTQSRLDAKNEIHLTLQDDGIGLDPNTSLGKGLGLIGIRERINALSGQFNLYPATSQGTVLMLNIPL